jgi:hypothetical protein
MKVSDEELFEMVSKASRSELFLTLKRLVEEKEDALDRLIKLEDKQERENDSAILLKKYHETLMREIYEQINY